jgi:citrate lyase beta subunit
MSTPVLVCDLYGDRFPLSAPTYEHIHGYCSSHEFHPEFRRRSHLFVPLNKSRFLEKIGRGEVAADGFIWDLEDSIPVDQKDVARANIARLPAKPGHVEYNVRINLGDPSQLQLDLRAIAQYPFDSVTLPKGESAAELARVMESIGKDKGFIVTIETLRGLHAIDEIAAALRPGQDALGFGVGDMSTDLGVERLPTFESPLFQQILGTIVMTAKRHHLDVFDSVSARFNDPESGLKEAQLSSAYYGCTGKKLINPKQLEAINRVFSPSREAIAGHLATLECFLGGASTNAHVVGGEYQGMPAFKAADRQIMKLLRQGYLRISTP